MKKGNRDINVIEWANNSKFREIDDIVTSLRLLKLFFEDVLGNMIVGYTKLCRHREKADINFEINNENNLLILINILLVNGCHKLPDRKMYWETTQDTFV